MKKVFLCLIIVFMISVCVYKQSVYAEDTKVFYNSEEYSKIIQNKKHITQVIKKSYPEGGYEEDICDIEKAYKMVQNLKSVKKVNIALADADSCYIFNFDDNTSVNIHFEGPFLHYKGQNYEIIRR